MIRESDSIILTKELKRQMRYLAIEGYPFEVCGVLHKHNIIHQYPNTYAGDHRHGFDMEVDIHNSEVKAIWHSHPGGLREPSNDDLGCMEHLYSHGFVYPWLIITAKEVTQWIFEPVGVVTN